MDRLTVEDFLLIAEIVLGVPAKELARTTRLATAAAALAAPYAAVRGRARHATLAEQAAVLGVRLVRDRPLRKGNEAVALLAMLELVARNHGVWTPPTGGQDEIAFMIERLAAGELSEAAFRAWVRAHVDEPLASR
jgi:prophage maintenance system killer protein